MKEEIYFFNPKTEEKIEISKEVTTVGRSNENDFPIGDQSVSSRHAKVILKDDGVYVVDLNSFNSTYVNNKECEAEKEIKIKVKDIVQFGDIEFYFSSTEVTPLGLDLPSITDSFNINAGKTQDVIVHNYEEPIVSGKKKKVASLKSLRAQKDEIDGLHKQLSDYEINLKKREKIRARAEAKAKELEEFNTYLKAKNNDSMGKVESTIETIIQVNERYEKDKDKVKEQIAELQAQINKFNEEIESLNQEKATNEAILEELRNDIEILKGRDSLEEELSKMYREIRKWEKEDVTEHITMLKVLIEEKEEKFKKVQKDYADSRFGNGNKDIFGNKKAS